MNPILQKNRLFADRRTSFSQRSLGKSVSTMLENLPSLRKFSDSLSGASDYSRAKTPRTQSDGPSPSTRTNVRDLRKISPLGRNDQLPLAAFAPLRETIRFGCGVAALAFFAAKFRLFQPITPILQHSIIPIPLRQRILTDDVQQRLASFFLDNLQRLCQCVGNFRRFLDARRIGAAGLRCELEVR